MQACLWACGRGDMSTPSFGSNLNHISTRGADYTYTKFWKLQARLHEHVLKPDWLSNWVVLKKSDQFEQTQMMSIFPFVYPNQIATTTIAKSQLRVVFKVYSTHFTTWLGLCSLTLCLSSGRHRNLVVIIIFYTTSNSFKNHWCNRSTLILWQSFQRRDYIKGLQHLTISEVWSVNDKAVSNLLFLEVSSGFTVC